MIKVSLHLLYLQQNRVNLLQKLDYENYPTPNGPHAAVDKSCTVLVTAMRKNVTFVTGSAPSTPKRQDRDSGHRNHTRLIPGETKKKQKEKHTQLGGPILAAVASTLLG